jgi:hypothetical protein
VGEGQLRENGEIEIVLVLNQAFNLSIEGGKNKAIFGLFLLLSVLRKSHAVKSSLISSF